MRKLVLFFRCLLHIARFSGVAFGVNLALAGELKVDINRDSRNTTAETETGYTRWSTDATGGAATGTAAITKTFTSATGETITIGFAQTATSQSRGGTGLLSNWYQVGTQGTAKLVSDGLSVAPANLATGGEMQMTITGLSAGHHTLLTYHNAWDALTALVSVGPIDISVNGAPVVGALQPTIRAATNTAAANAYVEFDVASTSAVTTILFSAQVSSSAATKNVMINGFEIDTPNSNRTANGPSPADGDEHVDADNGSATLSWSAAPTGAASHDVYFGTDKAAVQAANRSSTEFKGNRTALTYNATGLNGHLTYYWRVDEFDAGGNTTKGTVWYFRPRQLAFPGAEGYGRFARGGRGGSVVHVTSLADYTGTPVPGTLRYAIEEITGPRTIVFDVSGLITLESRLSINSPYLTIAGQTAPGKGITVRKYTIGLSGARDVIVRHLRSRPGKISGTTIDGMGMAGSDHSILDHCSVSWSLDEAVSSRSAKNITLQRTLISEALNNAGHQNYPAGTEHGYAASIGGDKGSFHHNLLAHCYGRNWSLAGGLDAANNFSGRLDITNNVVYNWGSRTTDGGAMEVNFVNNYYKPGPGTTHVPYALTIDHENNFGGSQRAYFAGNVMPGHFTEANQTAGRRSVVSNGVPTPTYETFVDAPFFTSFVATQSAADAYKRVLSDVGCNQPLFDDHDIRIVNETLAGNFTYRGSSTNKPGFPDAETDVGGWENYPEISRVSNYDTDGDGMPDWWEKAKGFNVTSTPSDFTEANADPNNDGFTNLEDFLNWLATPHVECAQNTAVNVDLSQLTRGYTSDPMHAVSGAVNGAVTLGADGKTATFTSAAGFSGLAAFNFSVTDSAGSSMTGTVNVRVIAAVGPTVGAPAIATPPQSRIAAAGTNASFTVEASGAAPFTYQWLKDGTVISGATSATFTLGSAQLNDAGQYSVVVTNSAGTATSSPVSLAISAPTPGSDSRLFALSCRAMVGAGGDVLIPSFIVGGSGSREIIVRASGPALTAQGVSGALAQPQLRLHQVGIDGPIATNIGWSSGTAINTAALQAAFTQTHLSQFPVNSADCALIATAEAGGAYTAVVSGANGTTGVALVEVYELGSSSARMTAIACRAQVGTGDSVLIPGILIVGSSPKQVIVRASGPAIQGVSGTLAQPHLQLYNGGTKIAENTGWSTAGNAAAVFATSPTCGLVNFPPGSADCVILVTLPPGAYTAIVSGLNSTTGVALLEIYEVP